MALVQCAPFVWPYSNGIYVGAASGDSRLINATGERLGIVCFIPETGTIDKVSFYLENVTNVSASTQITVSLFTIDVTTGFPTTTLLDAANGQYDNTAASQLTTNSWNTFDFTGGSGNGAASVTKGDYVGIVIAMTTLGGSDSFEVELVSLNVSGRPQFPYPVYDTGGGYAKQDYLPNVIIEYASTTFHPAPELGGFEVASNTVDEEKGIRFKTPFPCRISGLILPGMRGFLETSVQFHLMADATAPGGARLASTSDMEDDVLKAPTSNQHTGYVRFDTPLEIAKDVFHRLISDSTGGAWQLVTMEGISNASLNQSIGTIDYYVTSDDGASGWTNETSKFAQMYLVIDQIDDGTGGGGGGGIAHIVGQGGIVG